MDYIQKSFIKINFLDKRIFRPLSYYFLIKPAWILNCSSLQYFFCLSNGKNFGWDPEDNQTRPAENTKKKSLYRNQYIYSHNFNDHVQWTCKSWMLSASRIMFRWFLDKVKIYFGGIPTVLWLKGSVSTEVEELPSEPYPIGFQWYEWSRSISFALFSQAAKGIQQKFVLFVFGINKPVLYSWEPKKTTVVHFWNKSKHFGAKSNRFLV